MSNTQILGQIAEEHAASFMLDIGFQIITTNWRFRRAEIDIIASRDGVLHFVEVKSRSYNYYGSAEESIDLKKQSLIIDAAFQYMSQNKYKWAVQFDIISVYFNPVKQPVLLKYFEDSFF